MLSVCFVCGFCSFSIRSVGLFFFHFFLSRSVSPFICVFCPCSLACSYVWYVQKRYDAVFQLISHEDRIKHDWTIIYSMIKPLAEEIPYSSFRLWSLFQLRLILFSAVRSNPRRNVGFLADWRRLNVMITRARRGLVIIGDMRTLKRDPAWSAYIDWAKDAGYLRQVWTSLGRQCPSMNSLTCSWTWAAKETASLAMRPCSYKTWDMGSCINLCHVKTMCLSSCFNQWTENLIHIQRPSPLKVYPQRSWSSPPVE